MKENNQSIFAQIHRNAVAIISLVVAVSGLSYNTWRNEKTEDNRNQRVAAFELLLKLNELQEVVFYHYYEKDAVNKGNPRTGWTYVLTIHDLSQVLKPPLPAAADKLRVTWNENWPHLGDEQASVDAVLSEIDEVRGDTIQLLKTLE
jgi:hypothetical protein